MSSAVAPLSMEANGSKAGSPSKPKREKHLIAGIVVLAIVLVGFIIAVIILAVKASKPSETAPDVCRTPACVETALYLMHSMNTSADPCEDFYKFACGNWGVYNEDRGGSALEVVLNDGHKKMHENMIKAMSDETYPSSVRTIATSYLKCGFYGDLKEEDKNWLDESLTTLGGWPMTDSYWDEKKYHWERNLAQAIHDFVIATPLAITVEENPFDTRKRNIQVSQPNFEDMESLYEERILSIAKTLSDRDESLIEKEYKEVEEFYKLLSKGHRRGEEIENDPTQMKVMTIRQLGNTIPWINWLEFLRTSFGSYLDVSINEEEPIVVLGVDYLNRTLEMLFRGNVTARTFANFIGVTIIQSFVEVNEKLGQVKTVLRHPRMRRLKEATMPEGFSSTCFDFYTQKAYPATDYVNYRNRKAATVDKEMIDYFVSAMDALIKEASWLDDTTRKNALNKLHATKFFVGFPERYKDPKEVEKFFFGLPNMTSNLLQDQAEIRRHLFRKTVELLRKIPDKNKWPYLEGTHATQINAFHVPQMNAVVLPADMQVKPLFDAEKPKFWNYALYGWVLGHEITHGLDTSGSRRDKDGNMRNWWLPQTKRQFNERAKCIIDQYDKLPYGYDEQYVNGTQTVGENVADNGGLRQAYKAYKKWEKDHGKEKRLPALEQYNIDQLFFISVAQGYCAIPIDPEIVFIMHASDSHSPTSMRFNPAAANFDQFGKTFNCKPGSPMNPAKKCIVW